MDIVVLPLQYALSLFGVPAVGYFIIFAAVFSMFIMFFRA